MWLFQVTSLKQYEYCPRVVFYTYCLPLLRPVTYKMEASAQAHEEAAHKEKRRTLGAYGLTEGERHFDVSLTSETLGLSGQLDMVIVTEEQGERRAIPVDYKLTTRQAGAHFKLQLTAYALLLEENWHLPVQEGFLYSFITRRAERIAITAPLRRRLQQQLQGIRTMIETEQMPPPVSQRSRCVNCEFRRFCNDVL
jgi:CRISPR-associated exonuclease Cas4